MDNWSPTPEQVEKNKINVLVHKAYQARFSKDIRARMKAGPPPTFMEDFQRMFKEADLDGDGALSLEEWHPFRKKFTDYMTAAVGGTAVLTKEEDDLAWENLQSSLDPSYVGVKVDDLFRWMKISGGLAMKPESVYRIWYFPFYGRGEPIRLLLTHAGIPYEDMPVPVEQWPNLKNAIEGHTMPAIETQDGEIKSGATRAAMRYLGLKYGYYPDDPMRAQECDMLTDGFLDVFEAQREALLGKNNDPATLKECREKYFGDVLPKFLTILEPYCARGQFLCGNKLCVADFWIGSMIFSMFKNPNVMMGADKGMWDKMNGKFPAFAQYSERFVKANTKRMATRPPLPL